MQGNSDFFTDFVFTNPNKFIAWSIMSPLLKLASITPVHKNLVNIKRFLTARKFSTIYFENIGETCIQENT